VGVDLRSGRRSSFEVSVDGEVIHSRLDSGEWPDTEMLLAAIASRVSA
jgi:predicted Rdx family selenoprotein